MSNYGCLSFIFVREMRRKKIIKGKGIIACKWRRICKNNGIN